MPTINITYESGITEDRQDAAFYVGNYHEVVNVSDGTRTFGVYVCGETRVYVWNDEIDKAGEEEPAGRHERHAVVAILRREQLHG